MKIKCYTVTSFLWTSFDESTRLRGYTILDNVFFFVDVLAVRHCSALSVFYQTECSVCHLPGRSTLCLGANIKRRNCEWPALNCLQMRQLKRKREEVSFYCEPFLVCVCVCVCIAVNSVASDSQICRIYYIVGFFLALSHFESRRPICVYVPFSFDFMPLPTVALIIYSNGV